MERGPALTSWRETEGIIHQEVRRFRGTLPGYDAEDLRQECRIAVAARLKPERDGARTYARAVARDRLTNLLRASTTFSRCPHDAWGRPRPSLDGLEAAVHVAHEGDVESNVANREALSLVREKLDPRDWQQLVEVALNGARAVLGEERLRLASARAEASAILRRIGYRVFASSEADMSGIPKFDPSDVPECHAKGTAPVGYDPNEAECINCRDKFTCLPMAIEQKLVQLRLSADLEVEAVVQGRMAWMDGIGRMKRRLAKAKAHEEIEPNELPTWPGLAEGAAEEAEELEHAASDETPEETAEPEPEAGGDEAGNTENETEAAGTAEKEDSDVAKKKGAKKAAPKKTATAKPKAAAKPAPKAKPTTKAKPPAKPAAAPASAKLLTDPDAKKAAPKGKAKPAPKAAPKPAAKPAAKTKPAKPAKAPKPPKAAAAPKEAGPERPKSWPTMSTGKPLPGPKSLTEEEMTAALAETQAKLGANIRLEYGMQIARRKRGGDTIVTITQHGFEYEVDEKLAGKAEFKKRKQLFGSLSSVAMWAERRMVSGNDFFNLSKHNCTEVRDVEGRIIDRKGGVGVRK